MIKKSFKETLYSILGWLAIILIIVDPIVGVCHPAIEDYLTQLGTATPTVNEEIARIHYA